LHLWLFTFNPFGVEFWGAIFIIQIKILEVR